MADSEMDDDLTPEEVEAWMQRAALDPHPPADERERDLSV